MSYRCPFFVRLDEDILQDPEVQSFIEDCGFEGLGVYLSLLTMVRAYESTDYMIPYEKIPFLARKVFCMSEKRLKAIIKKCQENNLLDYLNDDGKEYFYSMRRANELLRAEEVRQKQSAGGRKGMKIRYESKSG